MGGLFSIFQPQAKPLSIDSIVILQDSEGRYCLNELHKQLFLKILATSLEK
jgi:hypothetical protein